MASIGQQCHRIAEDAGGHFRRDESEVERDGNREGRAMPAARRSVIMMVAVAMMMPVPVIVLMLRPSGHGRLVARWADIDKFGGALAGNSGSLR